ncbi:MAG: hypothetical protein Q9165_002944 [Trypethelium subeluteriae]
MAALLSLLWALCALCGSAASQTLAPTNASAAPNNELSLSLTQGGGTRYYGQLIPLIDGPGSMPSGTIIGTLIVATDPSQDNSIIGQDIAYLDCNPASYPGNLDALQILQQVQKQGVSAVIFYTSSAATCNYTAGASPPLNSFIYAMTDQDKSASLYNELTQPGNNGFTPLTGIIARDSSNDTSNNNPGNQPLGPSPSTAVAMIILYSITGVITALFLIIIVTGAVRAHRHPERYGPRNAAGRPRQTRVKGLARAMLETIPIVKFGERQPDKDADIEIAPVAGEQTSRDQPTRTEATGDQSRPKASTGEHISADAGQATEGHQRSGSEISAAAVPPANASTAQASGEDKEGLGCSICTEDFERGQDIRVLPCDHKFHPACIDPWLLNVSGTCPLCRIDLRPRTSHSLEQERDDASQSGSFAPPLAENDESEGGAAGRTTRRMSMLRNVLHMRTAEERAAALRAIREEQEEGDRQEASESNDAARRRNRLTTRLQDVFRVRTRRNANVAPEESGSPSRT